MIRPGSKTEALLSSLALHERCSASREWLPDPNSRWGELVSAANQFLDLLGHFAENHGMFGIARFPAANPATYDIVPMTKIPGVAGMAAHQTVVAVVLPNGGTPMGDELDRVLASAAWAL